MSHPRTPTGQSLERSIRLHAIAEQYYQLLRVDDRATLTELPPRERLRYLRAAEMGWDYLQHGEPPQ